ncbi:polysaccharide lyase family 1 protein [Collybiopsis luxurians FD-317 M1]|uniref:Polysaccharide lyase family 1 protein n=1 Tax=Collybiopsis luxurians FD-317 M1 TaxID=944289 RepID=A0A0D0C773_9AGAR|nr:polysaccharide lyase family 1 protein [Collybiopsis luxurians FD-317 M1]
MLKLAIALVVTYVLPGLVCALRLADESFVPPVLPHSPFGYGGSATGGSLNTSSVYIVSNTTELREALALPFSKTIYVNGTINGNELSNGTAATCQDYIDMTGSDGAEIRQFNFTLYILGFNTTYMNMVDQAIADNVTFQGMNATDYKTLIDHMNGWRPVIVETQKAQVGFTLTNDTSLIGLDENAALNGINLYVHSVNNIWIRNLKLVSPQDCFPAPETFPSSWNAEYDAVGLVTATNVWLDGCELQDQLNGEYVQPDMIDGWQVDRFDGLFDCEDGTDNITFSHNLVSNHHKSMLLGGGTKEFDLDLGHMHFTIFGNHFNNSASRNPLMRFGTFDVFANVYETLSTAGPVFDPTNVTLERRAETDSSEPLPDDAIFEYNLGVYNQSTVQLQDNVFIQTGPGANDTSRIFTISEATLPEFPARVCIHESNATTPPHFLSTLNGQAINNLTTLAQDTIDHFVENGDAAEGAVIVTCEGIEVGYALPASFTSAQEVLAYVLEQAGQVIQK